MPSYFAQWRCHLFVIRYTLLFDLKLENIFILKIVADGFHFNLKHPTSWCIAGPPIHPQACKGKEQDGLFRKFTWTWIIVNRYIILHQNDTVTILYNFIFIWMFCRLTCSMLLDGPGPAAAMIHWSWIGAEAAREAWSVVNRSATDTTHAVREPSHAQPCIRGTGSLEEPKWREFGALSPAKP